MSTIQRLIVIIILLCAAVGGSLLLIPDEPDVGIYGSYEAKGALILMDDGKGCFLTKQRMSPILWQYDRWSRTLTITGHFTDDWSVKDTYILMYDPRAHSFKGDGSRLVGDGPYDYSTATIPSIFDWVERYEGTAASLGYKE